MMFPANSAGSFTQAFSAETESRGTGFFQLSLSYRLHCHLIDLLGIELELIVLSHAASVRLYLKYLPD